MQNIVTLANSMMQTFNKKQIAIKARGMGWRGDDARAPMLQLALFVATKLAEEGKGLEGMLPSQQGQQQGQQGGQQGKQGGQQDDQQDDQQGKQGGQQGKQGGQQDDQQDDQQGKQDDQQQDLPKDWQQDLPKDWQQDLPKDLQQELPKDWQQDLPKDWQQFQKDAFPEQQDDQQQGKQQGKQDDQQDDQQQQQQDDQQQQQQQQQDDDKPPQDYSEEYRRLLKASGLAGKAHRLLEKLWRLTVKGRVNVMMVGPAGAGKGMLAEQLAMLVNLPFAEVSCSEGMSESHLLGRALPVDGGAFKFFDSPLIANIQRASVSLIDEVDGADANVLLSINSLTANGRVYIPQRIDAPLVVRHADAIIVAAANTTGNGADEMHSARNIIDGATLDRFYTMPVDYDTAYIVSLFNRSGKGNRKAPAWKASMPLNDAELIEAGNWFRGVMVAVKTNGIARIVATRFAQKFVAAIDAGIPADEVKNDLTLSFSADEKRRIGL